MGKRLPFELHPFADKEFIAYAAYIQAIEFVPRGFIHLDGRVAPYLLKFDRFHTGDAKRVLARSYVRGILSMDFGPEVIYDPTYRGTSLVEIIVEIIAAVCDKKVEYAYNRREMGTSSSILAGAPLDGKRVLIINDDLTIGGPCEDTVRIITAHGGNPIACCIAFDRQERAVDSTSSDVSEFMRKHNMPVHPIATVADLISYLEEDTPENTEILKKLVDYLELYGASP